MKFRSLILLLVLFPLSFSCDEGNKPDPIPPPSSQTPGNEDGGKKDDDDGTPKPWDANRGKVVRPEAGNGWTVTSIDGSGVVYYNFEGKEPVSHANQRIFVTDIDLNDASYQVKLAYYAKGTTASKVFKGTGALACINCGYEKAALYIVIDGSVISTITADTIGSTGVPQWKSEAALYMDNERDVRIEFTGEGMNLAQWRATYSKRAKSETYMITSAPMLIDDYKPVGIDFCTLHPLASSGPNCSENPYVHQASTSNPRTAIAKTEDNHVLFIVVDGRRDISRGISAAELTNFLVKNFNPQYALNLDGGGSSTMCVKGQGDPTTNVVNYPTDSDEVNPRPGPGDHTGERSRDTYLYVVKKQ